MLSPRMPDLAALDVLLVVAQTRSLSKAAIEVGTSQQAISARITALENLVGSRLTTRTSRGTELTEHGRLVVEWADSLLRHAAKVDAGIASLRDLVRVSIRLSASLTIAEQLLPMWLVGLQTDARRHGRDPLGIVLTATNSVQVAEQVRSGEADLGFVEGPRAPRGLRSTVVAHDELILVVPPGHAWARRRGAVTVDELTRLPLVVRERGSGTRDFFETAVAAKTGIEQSFVEPALELSTSAAVRTAVLAGAGPTVVSRLAVGDDVAAGRLAAVRIADLDLRRDLRAIWVGGRTAPAGAARDMLAYIASSTTRSPKI
ncbi:LysR substrate-binding domain-containing protein [Allobranchiibius sp. GilTou73]|uniref:LysR substrate-binding domain-containing protein n=1 Tax=Allobranchiibius sp. GilTou73 TaxID=2904523 RepID=UPI001F1D7758|nr:LysR substrate-binding domain-containing protein [Allobranchiibius sp. GilTou73]UIJ33745.1 LysR substrate-binding domain-containing protein [Allobranchiibius sp. GilTou73]